MVVKAKRVANKRNGTPMLKWRPGNNRQLESAARYRECRSLTAIYHVLYMLCSPMILLHSEDHGAKTPHTRA